MKEDTEFGKQTHKNVTLIISKYKFKATIRYYYTYIRTVKKKQLFATGRS